MSKLKIRGANELLLPIGLIFGAILDVSRTFAKSGGLRGRTKVVTVAQEAPRGVNVDIWGANELIWPTGFIIDATPDASQTFTKSGGLKGHLKGV